MFNVRITKETNDGITIRTIKATSVSMYETDGKKYISIKNDDDELIYAIDDLKSFNVYDESADKPHYELIMDDHSVIDLDHIEVGFNDYKVMKIREGNAFVIVPMGRVSYIRENIKGETVKLFNTFDIAC